MNHIYCRVSNPTSNTDSQIDECIDFCKRNNCDNITVYEQTMTGRKGQNISDLKEILNQMTKGDTLIIYTVDRLSRYVRDAVQFLEDLTKKGCRILSIKENISYDVDDIYGRFKFRDIINHAELESDRLSLRLRSTKASKSKTKISNTKFQCIKSIETKGKRKRSSSGSKSSKSNKSNKSNKKAKKNN